MRHTTFHVDGVQPGSGAILRRRRVEQSAAIDQSRVADPGAVPGDSLGLAAACREAPDVGGMNPRIAPDEINKAAIRGPDRMVAVSPGPVGKERPAVSPAPVRDEHRIARAGLVIYDLASIRRPGRGDAVVQEWPRGPAWWAPARWPPVAPCPTFAPAATPATRRWKTRRSSLLRGATRKSGRW